MPRERGYSPNYGGKREGAGRPQKTIVISDAVKQDFLRAAKKKAKEKGVTLGELVMEEVYNPRSPSYVRASWLKLWASVVVVKETSSTSVKEIHKHEHGVVELPARLPDPAEETAPPLN